MCTVALALAVAASAPCWKRPAAGQDQDELAHLKSVDGLKVVPLPQMVNNVACREVVAALDQAFASQLAGLTAFVQSLPTELLYRHPNPEIQTGATVGENVLRCAAVLEQVFGGLTVNLWDDPFEWTLRETLSTRDRVIEYIGEVDAARQRAFVCFADDTDLLKFISVPSGEPHSLLSLLIETLVKASGYQGRAVATLKIFGDVGHLGFII
jgi:hypothetical protein